MGKTLTVFSAAVLLLNATVIHAEIMKYACSDCGQLFYVDSNDLSAKWNATDILGYAHCPACRKKAKREEAREKAKTEARQKTKYEAMKRREKKIKNYEESHTCWVIRMTETSRIRIEEEGSSTLYGYVGEPSSETQDSKISKKWIHIYDYKGYLCLPKEYKGTFKIIFENSNGDKFTITNLRTDYGSEKMLIDFSADNYSIYLVYIQEKRDSKYWPYLYYSSKKAKWGDTVKALDEPVKNCYEADTTPARIRKPRSKYSAAFQ